MSKRPKDKPAQGEDSDLARLGFAVLHPRENPPFYITGTTPKVEKKPRRWKSK